MSQDQRAAFEAWYRQHRGDRDVCVLDKSGEYADKQVQGAFNVWQARAALESLEVRELRDALTGAVSIASDAFALWDADQDIHAALAAMEKQK